MQVDFFVKVMVVILLALIVISDGLRVCPYERLESLAYAISLVTAHA